MRILFLTDNFPPELNAPATRTYEHAKAWVKKGAEVTVITCAPNFPLGKVYDGYKNKLYQKETIDGIEVIRVWTYIAENKGLGRRTLDFISFSFTSFLVGLFQRTDIIVATSPQFFTALAGRSLSFWKRKPWIMEVRDLWPESIKTVGAMDDNAFIKYFEKEAGFCYRSADRIVVVTDSFKKSLLAKGVEEKKIEVVKNGANLDLFQPVKKDEQLIKELDLEGKFILGYIGTHGMAHKLDFILDCAKDLDDQKYHFLFIGAGAEKDKLKEKVLRENITNVTMLDPVPKVTVKRYLSILDASVINLMKSDLFKTVLPSKIFENAAMEIPILLGVDGEARALVEKYQAGLYYEPENKEHFLRNLEMISSSKDLTLSLKQGGKKLAKDFDRELLADKMLHIIEAACESPVESLAADLVIKSDVTESENYQKKVSSL